MFLVQDPFKLAQQNEVCSKGELCKLSQPQVPGSFAGNKSGMGETMAKWCIRGQRFICQSWF